MKMKITTQNATGAIVAAMLLAGSLLVPASAVQAQAQPRLDATQITAKPLVYTYTMNWTLPRSARSDMARQQAAVEQILSEAQRNGEILGFGTGQYLIHAKGITHRAFWTARTAADCIKLEERLEKAGVLSDPVLDRASGFHPQLLMSSYYNWKPGAVTGGYTYEALMVLREDFQTTGYDMASKGFIVPMMEKLMKEGAIQGYQINLETYVHTEDMGYMLVHYFAKDPSMVDKFVNEFNDLALHNPLVNPAWYNQMERMPHYDFLARANYTYGPTR